MADTLQWVSKADTLGRIAQMPAMVAAFAAGKTVDPDMTGRTRHAVDERCEADLDRIDILDGRPLPPLLRQLTSGVSQPLWQAADPQARHTYPAHIEGPRWEQECQWIADVWTGTIELLDDDQWADLTSTVNQIWARLANTIGLRPPVRDVACPQCGARLTPDGDMLHCTAVTDHTYPGPARLATRWRLHPPMTTRELCDNLPGLTPRRVIVWYQRRKLKTADRIGHAYLWWPWDVISLLWPTIAQAVEAQEDAKGSAA